MSRVPFKAELGFEITQLNADSGPRLISGSGVPGGDAGIEDGSAIGSSYLQDNGDFYMKFANAGAAADWSRMARTSEVNAQTFKSLRAATGDAITAGARDLVSSPFSDDEGTTMVAADFTVGDLVLGGVGGTEALWEVTVISAPSVTFAAASPALAADDNFICANYLPDSDGSQENQAIVHFNGTDAIKMGDIDWDFATGINLSSGYAAANGTVSTADTVESAIQKLDGNQLDLTTLSGESQGSTDHGTFTGTTISDSQTTHAALQDLETFVEALSVATSGQTTGITTATVLDSVLVDSIKMSEWEVHVFDEATPANVRFVKVTGMHDGTASADASSADDSVHTKLKLGGGSPPTFSVILNGAGGSQTMQLSVTASLSSTFSWRRTDI